MTISSAVQSQFFAHQQHLIRLPLTTQQQQQPRASRKAVATASTTATTQNKSGRVWTVEEHNRFLEALERFPSGPWKLIAAYVATRTTRQTMTHAQKYREKIARRTRAQDESALALAAPPFRRIAARNGVQGVPEASKEHNSILDLDNAEPRDDILTQEDAHFENCVQAAIAALLDEYEPFDLLGSKDAAPAVWTDS